MINVHYEMPWELKIEESALTPIFEEWKKVIEILT